MLKYFLEIRQETTMKNQGKKTRIGLFKKQHPKSKNSGNTLTDQ